MHFILTQVLPTVSLLVVPFLFASTSRSAPTALSKTANYDSIKELSSLLDKRAIAASSAVAEDVVKRSPVEVTIVRRSASPEPSHGESNVLLRPQKRWGSWGGNHGCCGW
jgi:hypothetical protein